LNFYFILLWNALAQNLESKHCRNAAMIETVAKYLRQKPSKSHEMHDEMKMAEALAVL